MPLAIASYSVYSQLSGAAPEIKGMWGMTQIPGTRREDGSIDRTQARLRHGGDYAAGKRT